MDREQVEKWAREAGVGDGPWTPHGIEVYTELCRLVHNAALEEAKAVCLEIMPEHNHLIGPYQCAKAIDALKEPQP